MSCFFPPTSTHYLGPFFPTSSSFPSRLCAFPCQLPFAFLFHLSSLLLSTLSSLLIPLSSSLSIFTITSSPAPHCHIPYPPFSFFPFFFSDLLFLSQILTPFSSLMSLIFHLTLHPFPWPLFPYPLFLLFPSSLSKFPFCSLFYRPSCPFPT